MAYLAKHSRNEVWHLTLQLLACTSHMAFSQVSLFTSFLQVSHKIALIFIACLILHQLNTKVNTIILPMFWNDRSWSDCLVFVEKNPLKFTKCHLVIHEHVWHGRLGCFGWSWCLWTDPIHIRDTYCWASFLVNWSKRGLVMDDQHRWTKINLSYHQLPLCPCVVHTTVKITVVIIIIVLHMAIF